MQERHRKQRGHGHLETVLCEEEISQLSGPIPHCLILRYLLRGFENQSFNGNIPLKKKDSLLFQTHIKTENSSLNFFFILYCIVAG